MRKDDKHYSSVLIVNDSKDELEALCDLLETEGYTVALAISTGEARKILDDTGIDLVLLDLMLSGTDSFAFCRQIKEKERFSDLPVIFLAAKNDESHLDEIFAAGGVDYIAKPVQKKELISRVNNHIELSFSKKQIIRQAEEIKKVNRTIDLLYAIIAHDIKSAFGNISMFISTLSEDYLEPGSKEYEEILQSINRSTRETYALLDNLLHWTRSQTGELKVEAGLVDLDETVDNALRFMEMKAASKNITLEKQVSDNLFVNADRNMLQSIIQNLIHNAVKFTKEGGKVTIQGFQDNKQVIVKVTDTGVGIPKENMKKLFLDEKLFTTPGTDGEMGSGLGLLLVQTFVRRNYGTIEVDSKPGVGSTFTISLPGVGT